MDVREKLVELLNQTEINKINGHTALAETCFTPNVFENMANNLIAHGVTVQMPQKPIEQKVEGGGIRIGACLWGNGTTIYKCPKCGNFISRIYDYCFKCGQAFDWSDMPQPPKGE